jgi:hypothetical protein
VGICGPLDGSASVVASFLLQDHFCEGLFFFVAWVEVAVPVNILIYREWKEGDSNVTF